jgi:arsenate reductase
MDNQRTKNLKKCVLFVCTGNSARSQMAEAILRSLAGDRYEVYSAGTHPEGLHPLAAEVMQEIGTDISRQESKSIDTFRGQQFDCVITVCDQARQQCPTFPGGRTIHWALEDPAAAQGGREKQRQAFRDARDRLREKVRGFLAANERE